MICPAANLLCVYDFFVHNPPTQALMLFIRPVHSKAFSSFSCVMHCCLFHALYEPFKAFLCLFANIGKVGVEPAACEEIDVCNPMVLFQIVQMPLSRTFNFFTSTNLSGLHFGQQSRKYRKTVSSLILFLVLSRKQGIVSVLFFHNISSHFTSLYHPAKPQLSRFYVYYANQDNMQMPQFPR